MAATADDDRGLFMANAITLVGFVVLFTVFVTDTAMSVVIGVIMIVAGGLWSGLASGGTTDASPDG